MSGSESCESQRFDLEIGCQQDPKQSLLILGTLLPVPNEWMLFPLPTSVFLFVYLALVKSDGDDNTRDVVLIKVGGSSITDKAQPETLNRSALAWFAQALAASGEDQDFVVVHGAGSFGHFVAKEYGLGGKTVPPWDDQEDLPCSGEVDESCSNTEQQFHRKRFGLSLTRSSVQKLNHAVVESLVQAGIPAVSLSPCFAIPGLQAHGSAEDASVQQAFRSAVHTTLRAGFVPVIHGDACLYGANDVGILSGDTIMQLLGDAPFVSRSIFLTDVDGVFTVDPRVDRNAVHIPQLRVNSQGELVLGETYIDASGSQHRHDVTGGFKTKLAAATAIASTGKVVAIAKCGSAGANAAIRSGNLPHGDDPLVSYLIPTTTSS